MVKAFSQVGQEFIAALCNSAIRRSPPQAGQCNAGGAWLWFVFPSAGRVSATGWFSKFACPLNGVLGGGILICG